jgi:hypothetical protein
LSLRIKLGVVFKLRWTAKGGIGDLISEPMASGWERGIGEPRAMPS